MKRFYRAFSGLIVILLISGLAYILINSKAAVAIPEPYTDPHGSYDSGTPKCAKCHSGHSSAAQGIARQNSQRETCYACHKAVMPALT